MKLLCITTDIPLDKVYTKSVAFFLEVGEDYETDDEQVINGEIHYTLKEDSAKELYPAYFFEIVK